MTRELSTIWRGNAFWTWAADVECSALWRSNVVLSWTFRTTWVDEEKGEAGN